MTQIIPNKLKIFNDPIYGFVNIPFEIIYDIIEHSYFQRLRNIKQLGLANLVYPGALNTRFHHAIGAMHLTSIAIDVLRSKGNEISQEEAEAVTIAILLHDIGHGPFSHTLEHSIVCDINHEYFSKLLMEKLNEEFGGRLSLAIKIFNNDYEKKFLHQLISSQLDMDRLDYLKRDSFYSGVSEGVINSDRIISMLNIINDGLVVEAKGIYSIEKFIIARRLMYWQVYLHKTVLSAEQLLIKIMLRAKELAEKNIDLFATPTFREFLYNSYTKADFSSNPDLLEKFAELDDYDIMASIKVWTKHSDVILSKLCNNLFKRNLYKIILQTKEIDSELYKNIEKEVKQNYSFIDNNTLHYFLFKGQIKNNAYDITNEKINILYRNGDVIDIADAADNLNISVLSKPVIKNFLCYPKKY